MTLYLPSTVEDDDNLCLLLDGNRNCNFDGWIPTEAKSCFIDRWNQIFPGEIVIGTEFSKLGNYSIGCLYCASGRNRSVFIEMGFSFDEMLVPAIGELASEFENCIKLDRRGLEQCPS